MDLKHNFGAGPAKLPPAVLETARRELMDYQGTGISVMEMSHRSKEFQAIAAKCEQDLREILSIGEDYAVLFMQGGATTQFSCVPLNINRPDISPRAAYIDTGFWSDRAIAEAKRLTQVDIIAESRSQSYRSVPQNLDAKLKEARDTLADSQYLHFTDNETIHGIEFPPAYDFQNGDCPLVSDMSSNIMSRRLDVSRYGLIYAGAQKNMGPSGLTIVIVRKDLIGLSRSQGPIPYLLDYKVLADNDSMANTPPTFAWYLCGLVCKWVKDQGGLEAIEAINAEKARILYETIDESRLFANPVDPAYRSRMNVPFVIKQADPDKKIEKSFLALADKQGFIGLAGHRAVGGMRASLYNAVDLDSTKALCQLIKQFDKDFS